MKRFVVGLTGGLAGGKSLALAAFRGAGAAAVSLDDISRDLSRPGREGFRGIVRAFGPRVLGPDGAIDRKVLAREVFSDPAARGRLERLLHPLIRREMRRRVARAQGVVVVEVPLLFEAGDASLVRSFDATVAVLAGPKLQARRARSRGMTAAQARARMAAQLPDTVKAGLADVAVLNTGTRGEFRKRIVEYYKAFESIRRRGSKR